MKGKIPFSVYIDNAHHNALGHFELKIEELKQSAEVQKIFIHAAVQQINDGISLRRIVLGREMNVQDPVFVQDFGGQRPDFADTQGFD